MAIDVLSSAYNVAIRASSRRTTGVSRPQAVGFDIGTSRSSPLADLAIEDTIGEPSRAQLFPYRLENQGPPTRRTSLTDVLPDGTTFSSITKQ
jgi:hypothetical protein